MRARWTGGLLVSFLALAASGCSDTTGPGVGASLFLDFCSGSDTPVFIAYQNEGQNWTRLIPDANGTIEFRPSDHVGLALVYPFGSSFYTDILYVTRADLEPLANANCPESVGGKTLNGSVAGVSGSQIAEVSMGSTYERVIPPPSTFTLTDLVTDPLDLIATRSEPTFGVFVPDRMILRRNVNLTGGATIPALDFGAAEAMAVSQHTATIAGLNPSESTLLEIDFSTATTPAHPLFLDPSIDGAVQTIYGVPSGLTQTGDAHILLVQAFSSTGNSYRVSEQFYQVPGSRSVLLGGSLNEPTVTTLASSPSLRLSTSLPSQTEYASFASVTHQQESRYVAVTETVGHAGGLPSSWVLDMPDLSGVAGYSSSTYALQSGSSVTSTVEAFDGTLSNFFGGYADGETFRFAGRIAGLGLMQALRTDGSRASRPGVGPLRGRTIRTR